ncbi:hypothetical protein [Streptosporangium vulgare]|uniref:Bacteriocin n=1 Tax=Streptosporangium vulgare TaxID=46190 RepID=A0ABV5T7X1_9ACTN
MGDMLKIDDLPAGVFELSGEDLEIVAGGGIQVGMKPGSGYICTALNDDGTTDCKMT